MTTTAPNTRFDKGEVVRITEYVYSGKEGVVLEYVTVCAEAPEYSIVRVSITGRGIALFSEFELTEGAR